MANSQPPSLNAAPTADRASAASKHKQGSTRRAPIRSISMAMTTPPTAPPNGTMALMRAACAVL
ncbi:hypothetical protein JOS77_27625 [Chromobacterium haemolyticum]|nr:hypothetical protein JOS77_27625 [Chromobacterium haemolyticum]